MDLEDALNLAIRRMLRASHAHYVLHVAFSSFGFIRSNAELLLLLQNTVRDIAQPAGATVYPVPRGDLFVILTENAAAKIGDMVDNITAAAFPDRDLHADDDQALVRVFLIPRDYTALRETANACLLGPPGRSGDARTTAAAAAKPVTDDLEGPLGAWSLSRLEIALAETDLCPYLRTQTVFETDYQGRWTPLFDEHFTSIADLHDDKFPKLTFGTDDRLFIELCRTLDRRSVPEVLRRHRARPGHTRSFNISLSTYHGAHFEKFIRDSVEIERRTLILEVNRSDLLHAPRETVKALAAMREAGFGTALDGITLDLLPFTALHHVNVDYIKIALVPRQMWLLKDADCVASLKKLSRPKIILCRCEKDSAVPVGQAFGVTKFQGWAIDRLAAQTPTA